MLKRRKDLIRSVSIVILLALFLVGCKKIALYHNLTEQEANELIVVLYEAHIDAEKEKELVQNEVSWNVTVEQKDLPRARKILVDRNLPQKRELGLSGVYKEKGLIPTPDEQKARFLLAIKGEIVNSIKRIPEVVDADVVINIPTPEDFSTGEGNKPTASVVLKIRPNPTGVSQMSEAKVQQFVANAIEDLNPRNVSVIISYMEVPVAGSLPGERLVLPDIKKDNKPAQAKKAGVVTVAGISVSKDSAKRLKIYLSIFFTLLIVMSAILIVNVVRTTRMRQEFKALSEGPDTPMIEGEAHETPPQIEGGEEDSEE
jgi:type III secretion protein J